MQLLPSKLITVKDATSVPEIGSRNYLLIGVGPTKPLKLQKFEFSMRYYNWNSNASEFLARALSSIRWTRKSSMSRIYTINHDLNTLKS